MSNIVRSFRSVFENRDLRRVEVAAIGSELAAFAYIVVLAVVAYESSGTGGVGILMFTRMAVAALTTPFTSALADRYPRKRVMIASNLLSAVMIAVLAVAQDQGMALFGLCVISSVTAIFSGVFRPSQAALLPALANDPEELTAANAVATTIEGVAIFFGPGIGGILLGISGPAVAFGFCVVGMLWSAVLIARVQEPAREPEPERTEESHGRVHEATAGVRLLLKERALLAVVGVYCVQTIVAGALGVFNVVLALEIFHIGNAGVGYLDSAFGVGGIIGGILAAGLAGSRRLGAWFAFGALIWGVGIALVGLAPVTVVAFILLAAVGVGNTVVDVAAITLIQRAAPAQVLARVFGVIESALLTGLALGSILSPVAISVLGAREAIVVTGLLLPLAVVLLGRRILHLDEVGQEVLPLVALLRGTSIFAPLPQATLEQVARRLEALKVPAGEVVITEGDEGDRFYLLAEGTAAVSVEGDLKATIESGGFFGEIALLRDLPRTATVTAQTEMQLYSLDREQFLAAVTGHSESTEEADLLISNRLAGLRAGATA